MRSMWQITCAVIDGDLTTKEQADALLAEEITEYTRVLKIPEDQARAQLLANLKHVAYLCVGKDREKIIELFLEKPHELHLPEMQPNKPPSQG